MSSESVLSIKNILADYLSLLDRPIPAPQIDAAPLGTAVPARDPSRQCALVLSPHPDDECLIGGLPLRLLQEENWQIINLAVTLGSKVARRGERNVELARSCAVLGFESFLPQADGFSEINIAGRETGALWDDQVARVAAIIAELQPDLIIHPHPADWNTTHVGTFLLAQDAMESLPLDFTCAVAYSE